MGDFGTVGGQLSLDLWRCAMHHDQFHAEAMEQDDVADNVAEIWVIDCFTVEVQNKGFSSVRVDIGG